MVISAALTLIFSGLASADTDEMSPWHTNIKTDDEAPKEGNRPAEITGIERVLDDREQMQFLLKPGSGLIMQGIPQLAIGVPLMLFGVCTMGRGDWYGLTMGFFPLLGGLLLTVSGSAMIGVGTVRNNDFESGKIDYFSPGGDYIGGGIANLFIGTVLVVGGSISIRKDTPSVNWGAAGVAIGSVFFSYGVGFLVFGSVTDFEARSGKQYKIKRFVGSLSPFVGCTGGMCDGNTSRATGRETYFAGIGGEF